MLAGRFLEVENLMRQPVVLFDPQIAFRMWKSGARNEYNPRQKKTHRFRNVSPSPIGKQSVTTERAAKAEYPCTSQDMAPSRCLDLRSRCAPNCLVTGVDRKWLASGSTDLELLIRPLPPP